MVDKKHSVKFQRPGLNGWLLMLFDWHKTAVLIVAVSVVAVGTASLGSEYPIYVLSGLFGGLVMLRFSDAAQVLLAPDECAMVRERLSRSKFVRSSRPEQWTPSLPSFLLWNDAVVQIDELPSHGDQLYRVTGPYSYLIRLIRGLDLVNP